MGTPHSSIPAPDLARWLRWLCATSPPPDDAAAARSHASDSAAFEEFFWRHERRVFGYLWRITGEEQAARDLTQDTFLRAWRHFGEIHDRADALGWLLRVASNLALTHLRRRNAPVGAAAPLSDRDPGASDPARGFAERDLVRQTLLLLSPQQRATLVLHEVYGFALKEIGATLGITPDAAKMTLHRARAHFRRCYPREEDLR